MKITSIIIFSLLFLTVKNILAKEITKEFSYDRGPDRINVSKYPKDMRRAYEVFVSKCSKCHTLARPINSPYTLPEEWEGYIKKMMRKPGSGIDPKSAKTIYEFLKYDSQVRKKELYEKKLKERR